MAQADAQWPDSVIHLPGKRYVEMERLDDLEAFVAIIEKGSQAAASRHLRRPLQSLNRSLMALERAVGVELVKRTTRRSEPTEAGRLFYQRIKPAVAEILEARNEAASIRGEVSGALKVGAPVLFAATYIAPIVSRFLKLYPNVEIELMASDEQVDLLAGRPRRGRADRRVRRRVPGGAPTARDARRHSSEPRPISSNTVAPQHPSDLEAPSLHPAGWRGSGRQMAVSNRWRSADA